MMVDDLRFSVRTLVKRPGFSILAAAVLALGIGAGAAIFSLVDATVLRPVPLPRPDSLVILWEAPPGYAHNRVSPLNFLDWSEQNHAFGAIAGVVGSTRTMTDAAGAPERIPGQAVTTAFFDVVGVRPLVGRSFVADDATPGTQVVMLSERFWRNRFGADETLIGRSISLDGRPYTVVGIVPSPFQLLSASDLWTVFTPGRAPEQRRSHFLQVVGRLAPGVTIQQARTDLAAIAANIARISPDTNKGWGVTVEPLEAAVVSRDLRTTSFALAGVVSFLLLMACANVASLMLARAVGREREIAVRTALGASRSRILRQMLVESALLAAAGGVAGLGLAWLMVRTAPRVMPPGTLPASVSLTLDLRLVAFTALLSLATGVICGVVPAWQMARAMPAGALAAGGRGATRGTGAVRSALAVVEVAAAVLLLSGAGLLLRTVVALNDVDAGYRADHVLTMQISLPARRYDTPERVLGFFNGIDREIGGIPAVKSVAFGTNLPLGGWDYGQAFEIVGGPVLDRAHWPAAHYQIVSPRYFETLGIPVLRGRAFTDRDTAASSPVCIVNEEFVKRHLKDRDPIGAIVNVEALSGSAAAPPPAREIVGVIRQVKVQQAGEKENVVEVYVPQAQDPWVATSIAIRAAGNPMALAGDVKRAIARVDKDQAVTRVRTMEEVAADSSAAPRFRAELVGAFAVLGIVLAGAGVFGVLAFSVSQRVREFGIRLALGARRTDVVKLVLQSAGRIVGTGVLVGLAGAAAVTRLLETLLFGVTPVDPLTFAAVPAVLALVALVACAGPAIRAAWVDPAVTLRQD